MRVADADEAVRLANDVPYGLAASVDPATRTAGEAIARRVEAGACCVNDAQVNYLALEFPIGSWKESGLGPPRRRRDPQVRRQAGNHRHPGDRPAARGPITCRSTPRCTRSPRRPGSPRPAICSPTPSA